jgi:hypothetical protein
VVEKLEDSVGEKVHEGTDQDLGTGTFLQNVRQYLWADVKAPAAVMTARDEMCLSNSAL